MVWSRLLIRLICGPLEPVALGSASAAVLVTGLMAMPCVNWERPPKIKLGLLKKTWAVVPDGTVTVTLRVELTM